MKKTTLFALALCLVVAVAAACALVDAAHDPTPTPSEPADPTPPQNGEEEPATTTITLYFADDQAQWVEAQMRQVIIENTLEETIILELIKGPEGENLLATIPEGTELLGLSIEDGIAYVDFSAQFKTNHWGGSAGELMTIQSIVASLTQLDEVDAVQLLLEGEKEDALFGHSCTAEPIEPDSNFIVE